MGNYAVIDNAGLIINRINQAHLGDWPVPSGQSLVAENGARYEIGGTYIGGVYTPPAPDLSSQIPPAQPASTAPVMVAAALNVNVVGGDIPGIDGPYNIAAAAYFDAGQYWFFFLQSQPDDNYFAVISGGAPNLTMTDHTADYFVIEAKDALGGAYVDAPTLSVQIFRIST